MFLSVILFLQIGGNDNYNTFFLQAQELRLVGENFRNSDRTASPESPEAQPKETQSNWYDNFFGNEPETVQYPLPLDENSPVSKCYSKHISTLSNSYGQILKTVESETNLREFTENSPLTPLTIVTDKNEVATKLNVKLLAYCETDNTFFTRNLNVLDSSDLTVRVFSSDSNNNNYEKTAIKKVDVRTTNLNPNFLDKWNEYGNVTIDLKTINDMIEGTQPLDSMQRIQVSGIMKIEFKDENKAWTWNFKLDPATSKYGSIQNSYVQVKVIPTYKNTGGSGGFDSPEPKINENESKTHTEKQEEACSAFGGTMVSDFICKIDNDTTVVEKDGTVEDDDKKDDNDKKDDKKEKVDFGLLNYKKLINCDNVDCLNDSDFIPIYGILGGILLLGVFQSKRQSRVVMIS